MSHREREKSSENPVVEPISTVKEAQKEQRNTILFMVTSLLAIILVCVAWFLNNQKVAMNNISIQSAEDGFELAAEGSAGDYDSLLTYKAGIELEQSSDGEQSDQGDDSGESSSTGSQSKRIGQKTDASHTQITWVMSDQSNMNNEEGTAGTIQPGTNGKLTFYVIPASDGTLSLHFNLNTTLYDDQKRIQSDETAEKLVEGHILFFETLGDDGYYDNLIEEGDFSTTLENAKAGESYPVTIYWTWVYVFGQNLLPHGNSVIEPWFSDSVRAKLCSEMESVDSDGTENENYKKYFYNPDNQQSMRIEKKTIDSIYNGKYSNDDFIQISESYNDADEYIGEKVRYIVLTLKAEKSSSGNS